MQDGIRCRGGGGGGVKRLTMYHFIDGLFSSTVDNNYDIDTYFFHKIVHAQSDLYRSIAISFLLTIHIHFMSCNAFYRMVICRSYYDMELWRERALVSTYDRSDF